MRVMEGGEKRRGFYVIAVGPPVQVRRNKLGRGPVSIEMSKIGSVGALASISNPDSLHRVFQTIPIILCQRSSFQNVSSGPIMLVYLLSHPFICAGRCTPGSHPIDVEVVIS